MEEPRKQVTHETLRNFLREFSVGTGLFFTILAMTLLVQLYFLQLVLALHSRVQSAKLEQEGCGRRAMECETVRYQMYHALNTQSTWNKYKTPVIACTAISVALTVVLIFLRVGPVPDVVPTSWFAASCVFTLTNIVIMTLMLSQYGSLSVTLRTHLDLLNSYRTTFVQVATVLSDRLRAQSCDDGTGTGTTFTVDKDLRDATKEDRSKQAGLCPLLDAIAERMREYKSYDSLTRAQSELRTLLRNKQSEEVTGYVCFLRRGPDEQIFHYWRDMIHQNAHNERVRDRVYAFEKKGSSPPASKEAFDADWKKWSQTEREEKADTAFNAYTQEATQQKTLAPSKEDYTVYQDYQLGLTQELHQLRDVSWEDPSRSLEARIWGSLGAWAVLSGVCLMVLFHILYLSIEKTYFLLIAVLILLIVVAFIYLTRLSSLL